MPFRKPSIQSPSGEAGHYKRIQGRHVFVPSTDESPEEVGSEELERWEHPTPSFKIVDVDDIRDKDKFQSVEDNLNVRNIHADGAKDSEPYIGAPQKKDKLPDKNKVSEVQLMDTIKYYLNGKEGKGTVYAISNEFFTVRKETGGYQDIQVSDIFFVEQILTKGKTWVHMDVDERTEVLLKARCPLSFVTRNWEDMPEEVVKVIKSNFEQAAHGGIDTSTHFDTTDDYEAVPIIDDERNFKHDNVKPTTSTDEPEQIPDSNKKPEVENKDGQNTGADTSAMISGAKAEDEDDKDKAEEEEIQAGLSSGGTRTLEHKDDSGDDAPKKKIGALAAGAIASALGGGEDKADSAVTSSDAGSFNGVHNSRFNSDNDNENHIGKTKKFVKKVGIPQSFSGYGVGYGVDKLEDE